MTSVKVWLCPRDCLGFLGCSSHQARLPVYLRVLGSPERKWDRSRGIVQPLLIFFPSILACLTLLSPTRFASYRLNMLASSSHNLFLIALVSISSEKHGQ